MRRVALLAALSAALFGGPAAADVVAEIKLSQQTMVVSIDGVVHHVWRVSTGRPGWAHADRHVPTAEHAGAPLLNAI
jgi:hypothetical protein